MRQAIECRPFRAWLLNGSFTQRDALGYRKTPFQGFMLSPAWRIIDSMNIKTQLQSYSRYATLLIQNTLSHPTSDIQHLLLLHPVLRNPAAMPLMVAARA